MTEQKHVKCVAVGDGAVGKTCLLMVYNSNSFPETYNPTVFDNYEQDTEVDGQCVKLMLADTSGQEDYDRMRAVSYNGAHIFIVCYSVMFPQSFENMKTKWIPEIRHCVGKDVRFIIIGLKEDLRNDQAALKSLKEQNCVPVSIEQGQKFAKQIGAVKHMVCSAKTNVGVKEVFEQVVRTALQPQKKKCF